MGNEYFPALIYVRYRWNKTISTHNYLLCLTFISIQLEKTEGNTLSVPSHKYDYIHQWLNRLATYPGVLRSEFLVNHRLLWLGSVVISFSHCRVILAKHWNFTEPNLTSPYTFALHFRLLCSYKVHNLHIWKKKLLHDLRIKHYGPQAVHMSTSISAVHV